MSTNGEMTPSGGDSASFWDSEGFKRTVKRTEDGMNLCGELMKMMQDRAEIEKEYAKRLKLWGKKWAEHTDKSPEYGTTKAMMKSVMEGASRLADVHIAVKDRILNNVQTQLKEWKNNHYKKGLVGGCKEAKTFEDEFRKAQKPWQKKLAKVTKAKKEYYAACKAEHVVAVQESVVRSSVSEAPPDQQQTHQQQRKAQEKAQKCKKETEAARKKYTDTLLDLTKSHALYVESMVDVFEKTQLGEKRRLDFWKTILIEFHNALNLAQNSSYLEAYQQINGIIGQADSAADLKWWSTNYGPEMGPTLPLPSYEEYTMEPVVEKAALGVRASVVANGDTSSTQPPAYGSVRSTDGTAPAAAAAGYGTTRSAEVPAYAAVGKPVAAERRTMPPGGGDTWNDQAAAASYVGAAVATDASNYRYANSSSVRQQRQPQQRQTSYPEDGHNPFDDTDSGMTNSGVASYTNCSEMTASATYSSGLHSGSGGSSNSMYEEIPSTHSSSTAASAAGGGVPVRALYDYSAVEADELNLTAGEIFLKIKDVDDQGWCTGIKDGRTGLYPENYAEAC